MSNKDDELKNPSVVYAASTAGFTASKKTIVVLGCPRGGTTMIAGLVKQLGVNMGDNLPVNLENQEFVGKSIPHMLETIKRNSESNDVWGWKFPRAANYLWQIHEGIVNPHYIVVWRDILSVAKRGILGGHDAIESMEVAHNIQAKNLEFLKKSMAPSLLVSYEKAIEEPVLLYRKIGKFLNLDPTADEDVITKFSAAGRYKPL